MRRAFALLLTILIMNCSLPSIGYGAANHIYLPESSGYQLEWEYEETPPKRPYPRLLNSTQYEVKWKMDHSLLFNLRQDQHGTLYATGSDNTGTSTMYAIYPNGRLKWSIPLDMGFDHSVIYFTLGQDGTIYAFSSDVLEQPILTSISAISPEGEIKWQLAPTSSITSQFDNQFAGDAEGNVVYFSSEGLVSRNAAGEINWVNHDIVLSNPINNLNPSYWSSIFIDLQGNIYVDTPDRVIISLNPAGQERWRSQPQNHLTRYSSFLPFFSDAGLLYMVTIDGLFALSVNDGSSVNLAGRLDYVDIRTSGIPSDGKGGFYIYDYGQLYNIDFEGNVKWMYVLRSTEKYNYSLDSRHPLATDDKGNVYFSTGVGNVIGLNSEGQEIFAFLRDAYWYIISDIVVGKNGNIYSTNMDIGLIAFGKKQIQVYVDNTSLPLSVSPIMENGSVLVPFRSLFESLGLAVGWDPVTQTITGNKEGLSIQMRIGSTTAIVNGEPKQLASAPRIARNSTYVPLRFIGEALNKKVSWDSQSSSVYIDSK